MMVELANNIILRMDTAGRITFINEFAGKFFGYAKKKSSDKILPEPSHQR